MSEELNPSAGTTTPAPEQAITDATPVAPPEVAVPETPSVESLPPTAEPVNTEVPAAAEQAPAPAEAVVPEEQKPAEEAAPAAPAEPAEDLTISDELVELAVSCIKSTHRSSVAHFQRKMGMSNAKASALVEELTKRGILGEANGPYPRKILIQCDPAPEAPKKAPAKKPFAGKPRITDYDRMQDWKKHLGELGKYTDEPLIEDLCQFAQKNPGFSASRKWGSCLIVMINRLANKTRDTLRTFTAADAEYVVRELLRFLSEQPLGDGPQTWNTRYTTNMDQKAVVSKFFGIDKPFREMRGKQQSVMTAIRDAAWPNQKEEANGTGGTYAERFHYMAMCIIAMSNGGHQEALFSNSYHDEPTNEFLNKFGGGPRAPRAQQPTWHTDGICNSCGGTVTTDSNGNTICSTPFCMHHFARTGGDVAESFRGGNHGGSSHEEQPAEPTNDQRAPRKKGNWKKQRREDDGGEQNINHNRGKKQRYRSRDDDFGDDAPSAQSTDGGGSVVASVGGTFNNNPFAGLSLPSGS